jgi:hypothetical protein
MDRLPLLKQLSFGAQVAEEETNDLASYFVETDQWTQIAGGKIDIVRGEKGAGKSAIYSLLIQRAGEFFDRGVLLVGAENPRGATVFKDLVDNPPTSEVEFIVLWKLYIATLIAQQLREYDVNNEHSAKLYRTLEDARLLEPEFSLAAVLHRAHEYAKTLLRIEELQGGITLDPGTQMPNGIVGRIILREPTSDLKKIGLLSVDNLFAVIDRALQAQKLKVWVLLDRLDVAFTENHALEANALRALIRVYGDIRGYENISLKIFLREDIWKRITQGGFREASHVIKFVVLDWTPPALLNLILRRLLNNKVLVEEFKIDAAAVLQDARKQEALFNRIFPPQVEQGARKPSTFQWIVSRCADGTQKTAPREIIHLLNCVRDQEIRRLEHGNPLPSDDQLFDRSVFKLALPTVSDTRLNQMLYAEYPAQRPFLEKLEGEKSEQTPDSLAKIWNISPAEAAAEAAALVEIGFFEARGTREAPAYWVPFLYRDALYLVQGRADEE